MGDGDSAKGIVQQVELHGRVRMPDQPPSKGQSAEPCSRRERALACRGTMAGRRLANALSPARMASRPRSGRWVAGRVSHLYLWVYGEETDRSPCGRHVCTCPSQMCGKEHMWAGKGGSQRVARLPRESGDQSNHHPSTGTHRCPGSEQSTGTRRDSNTGTEVVKKDTVVIGVPVNPPQSIPTPSNSPSRRPLVPTSCW